MLYHPYFIIYLLVAVYVDDKYEYDMAIRSTHYRGPGVFRAAVHFAHSAPTLSLGANDSEFFSNLLARPPIAAVYPYRGRSA